MNLSLAGIGKKFNRSWIFRDIQFTINSHSCAILGPNGSGKSTLLKLIAGQIEPDEGSISYENDIKPSINYCAPYLELPEEFTFREMLEFHAKFKAFKKGFNAASIIEKCGMTKSADKTIKHFSSGMRQRVKLALTFFYESDVYIFDEPTSHLDEEGVAWYSKNIAQIAPDALILVGSNQSEEYKFCNQQLVLTNF